MKETKGLVLGITGGVGTGKSEVLSYLATKPHTVVYDLDAIAHTLQMPGEPAYEAIVKYFGPSILQKQNTPNTGETLEVPNSLSTEHRPICREALGRMVFQAPEKLEVLNSLIHPRVMEKVLELIEIHKDEVLVIEGALLLEAGYKELCTQVWHIEADMEVRRQRVLSSRGYTPEKFQSIVENQVSTQELRSGAHRTIDNSGTVAQLHHCLDKIFYEINII